MAGSEEPAVVDAAAAAILNGTPIDWPALDARASASERELLEELRLLCTVADLHRDFPYAEVEPEASREGPPRYWGRLRLIERIGGGSFGDVYRAWDPRLRREVALKLIELGADGDADSAAIIREGRLLARVRHAGVVTIYDAERIGHRVGLSMEFVEGPTLEARIKDRGTLGDAEAIDFGRQLASAMSAAHAAGVLHRDIKAANVIIRDDGRAVLMDFGAGRHLEEADRGATGTPMYLAPEVLAGGEATVRSDIYSLGVLLHYALTGRYPVEAGSLTALRDAHARRRDASPVSATIGGRLGTVIARALDPRPESRFETAAAFEEALTGVSGATGRRRHAVAWLTAAAALGSLLLAGWAAGVFPGEADPIRLAVMPFEGTDAAASDGGPSGEEITRDLAYRLQLYDNARIISAGPSLSLSRQQVSAGEAMRQLQVDALLMGIESKSGDRLRIDTELHRPSLATYTRSYEGSSARRAEIHAELVRDLAAHIGLRRRAAGQRPLNPQAHALYIKGQVELDRMLPGGSSRALPLFLEALKHDPDYAQVHAMLPEVYLRENSPAGASAEALRLATEAAERAMTLDPNLPASHLANAIIRSAHGDWAAAERSYRTAIELGPGDVTIREHFAHWLSRLGRFDEAIEHARVAKDLAPNHPRPILAMASALRFARRWEESVAESKRLLDLDPGYHIAYLNLAHNLQALGRLPEAVKAFEEYTRPGGPRGNLGAAYAEAGRIDRAREVLAEMEAADNPRAGEIAQIYAGLGDLDKAFEWLARDSALASPYPATFLVARAYDPLRKDQRFNEVLKRHRLDEASLRQR